MRTKLITVPELALIAGTRSVSSPRGEMGQKYLASGIRTAMRLWENEPPVDASGP